MALRAGDLGRAWARRGDSKGAPRGRAALEPALEDPCGPLAAGSARVAEGLAQALGIAWPLVTATIDEKRGRAVDPAPIAGFDVPLDASLDRGVHQVRVETRNIQAEALREAPQVGRLEMQLIAKEQVVHLPEPILPRRSLRCLGGRLGMRVDAPQGKVPEYDLESVPALEQSSDDAHRRGRVRALEVAVDDQLVPSADTTCMVSSVHRRCQVEPHSITPGVRGRVE